jgi:hypothetical protein
MNFYYWVKENNVKWVAAQVLAAILLVAFCSAGGFWNTFGEGLLIVAVVQAIGSLFKKKNNKY